MSFSIGDLATTRFFVCSDCRKDESRTPEVRAIANSAEPSLKCRECGGSDWDELEGDDRREVIEHLGPKAIGNAVVFYCSRCRLDGVQVKPAGGTPEPCSCGSRHFRRLDGPERIKFLRDWEGNLE